MILLFFLPDTEGQQSLCPSQLLGLGKCPGCGIGHAIHDALHFRFQASFYHHLFGIVGVIIIFIRIKQLIQPLRKQHETQPLQSDPRS
ncbi:MAG: DUF2752 domain-containing protein [Sediminibacterium sp.]|uniref:DUF2752 domain-containing protein n=1 Tax=Sediminibacterium sp. TaxID=1917865 RepID=UPI003A0FFDDC